MIRQYPHRGIQYIHLHIQQICIFHTCRRCQHTASLNFFFLNIRQINCHTLSRIALFFILTMHLNTADLALFANRIHFQSIFFTDRTRHKSSGNNRAKPGQCKCAVNRKSRNCIHIFSYNFITCHMLDHLNQFFQSLAGCSRHLAYRCFFQKCAF